MTQFRSKKDGSHYPVKGGKKVYPSKPNRVEYTKAYKKLSDVSRDDDLDELENMMYDKFEKNYSHEQSLQIIINTAEGDYSQLSDKLAKIAQEEDKEMGTN